MKKKKALLLFTHNKGFLSGFFVQLAENLSHDGYKVICFSLKNYQLEKKYKDISIIIRKRGKYFSNYYEVFKIIRDYRPSLVISNFSYANPALIFGKIMRVKKNIMWFHTLNAQNNPSNFNIYIKKQFLKLADLVVANSQLTESELIRIYNVSQNRIICLPFWFDKNDFKNNAAVTREQNNDVLRIGCPGRLAAHKNHRIVIEAVHKLKTIYDGKILLYIAGRGPEKENLIKLCKNLGIKERVFFLDHLAKNKMVDFYREMDLVILPSLHEAFGLVFIEAINYSPYVLVSSNFGALTFIKESHPNLDKITFDPNSLPDLVDKIKQYVSNNSLANNYFIRLSNKYFLREKVFGQFKKELH